MSQKHEQIYQFARLTADMLGEKGINAKIQIHQICKKIGTAKVVELLKEVLAIEEQGGMLTNDKSHRRTPGGVFFALAKRDGYHQVLSPEQKKQMWTKWKAKQRAKKQQDRSQNDDGAKQVVQDRNGVDSTPLKHRKTA